MRHHVFGRSFRVAAVGMSAAVCLIVAGCGGGDAMPKLGKVTGKVTYKGKPVDSGRIVFTPAEGAGGATGQNATGEIAADGSYFMTTFSTGDGAILGQHIITVELTEKGFKSPEPKPDGTIDYVMPKSLGPKKYAKADTSPLRVTVVEAGLNYDIELQD